MSISTVWGDLPAGVAGTHYGRDGLGALGSQLPAVGQHGPALQYPHITLPAEADDEFRFLVLTVPPLLTRFEVSELGEVVAEGPDGVHQGLLRPYKNGVAYGDIEFFIVIGGGAGGTVQLDGVSVGGSAGAAGQSVAGGTVDLAGVGISGAGSSYPPDVFGAPRGRLVAQPGRVTRIVIFIPATPERTEANPRPGTIEPS